MLGTMSPNPERSTICHAKYPDIIVSMHVFFVNMIRSYLLSAALSKVFELS